MFKTNIQAARLVEEFFGMYVPIVYKKGEPILRAEDQPFGVYYLQSGYIRQYLLSSLGEIFVVHIYMPGSFFPLCWILNNIPNIYHFEAVTPVVLSRAPKDIFIEFLKHHPEVLLYTTQRLAAGLSAIVSRAAQLVLDDAYTKTIYLVLYYADHFGKQTKEGTALTIPLTHREIASWIGTTRETASLQVETLVKNGLLVTRGRLLIIPDVATLRNAIS